MEQQASEQAARVREGEASLLQTGTHAAEAEERGRELAAQLQQRQEEHRGELLAVQQVGLDVCLPA